MFLVSAIAVGLAVDLPLIKEAFHYRKGIFIQGGDILPEKFFDVVVDFFDSAVEVFDPEYKALLLPYCFVPLLPFFLPFLLLIKALSSFSPFPSPVPLPKFHNFCCLQQIGGLIIVSAPPSVIILCLLLLVPVYVIVISPLPILVDLFAPLARR